MRRLALALACGLLTATPVAIAQAAPAASPAKLALGVELARLLNSEESTLVQADKLIDETYPKMFAADPDFQAMEKQHPGVSKVAFEAMRQPMRTYTVETLPDLWQRLGTLYAQSLDERDIRAAIAFYRSPTGAKLIDRMSRGVDFSSAVETLSDDDVRVTAQGLRTGMSAGGAAAVAELNADELRTLSAFLSSRAGIALRGLSGKAVAVVVQWSNEPDPETQKLFTSAMREAINAYIAREKVQ